MREICSRERDGPLSRFLLTPAAREPLRQNARNAMSALAALHTHTASRARVCGHNTHEMDGLLPVGKRRDTRESREGDAIAKETAGAVDLHRRTHAQRSY